MSEDCEHKYVYGGIKYKTEQAARGGTQYTYFDWFFCEKCLESKPLSLDTTSPAGYAGPLFDATPLAKEKK